MSAEVRDCSLPMVRIAEKWTVNPLDLVPTRTFSNAKDVGRRSTIGGIVVRKPIVISVCYTIPTRQPRADVRDGTNPYRQRIRARPLDTSLDEAGHLDIYAGASAGVHRGSRVFAKMDPASGSGPSTIHMGRNNERLPF